MFQSDAKEASSILNLTLTKRHNIPMCGIPYHASHGYIARLLKAGRKIAICEQVKMPEGGKGIAEREVVEIITPGTVTEEDFLDSTRNNYLMSAGIYKKHLSISYIDLSTGEFYASSYPAESAYEILKRELLRLAPGELLIQQSIAESNSDISRLLKDRSSLLVNHFPDWSFDLENSYKLLTRQFKVSSLKGFGISDSDPSVYSCGVILEYLSDTSKSLLPHVRTLKLLNDSDFLLLDESSLRNLEITSNLTDGSRRYSLIEVVDHTRTAMGARRLKNWIVHPLVKTDEINSRLERVNSLYHDQILLSAITAELSSILDIERLSSRIAMEKAHARDLLSVRNSLRAVQRLNELLIEWDYEEAKLPDEAVSNSLRMLDLLEKTIDEDPSILLTEGRLIKRGWDGELDRLKQLKEHSREILKEYLEKEKEDSGINNLKIKYNKIIGYFIEVTKSNLNAVPGHFIRRQSLVGAERFTTEKLADLETDLNSASEKAVELEKEIFVKIRSEIRKDIETLLLLSAYIAEIDCVASFATAATKFGWVKPVVNESSKMDIRNGRHPVVEANLPSGDFIPNSLELDNGSNYFALITGPNMAGKSTFLRQNALIALLAQSGSFVPADSAEIGTVDKIFCRVGASDNLARGESTFLVEMNETANILNSASSRSLIIMDEVGRGTGTNDGLSIAWAVSEYLLDKLSAKTLFATHYHELTLLEHQGLINLSLEVIEKDENIIFLKRIKEGPADASYGIHVARLAGIPDSVITRAREIQAELESKAELEQKVIKSKSVPLNTPNLQLFSESEMIENEIKSCDLNKMTPLDALNKISSWKEKLADS